MRTTELVARNREIDESMNQEIKQRWVEALRSNQYQQTKGFLHDDIGFCCLGVLCDLAVQDGVIEETSVNDGDYFCYDTESTLLPYEVVEWARLSSKDPKVVNNGETTLSTLNDNGNSFISIAEVIDHQL